jgi:hypothetical protein
VVDAASDATAPATCSDTQADTHNCGACGHDCLGAACSGGLCAPEMFGTLAGYRLVVDDTNVYAVGASVGGTSVSGTPKAGGASFVVASELTDAGFTGYSYFLALGGGQLFWDLYTVGAGAAPPANLYESVFAAPSSGRGATPAIVLPGTASLGAGPFLATGVVGSNLYLIDANCGEILYVPVTGAKAWSFINYNDSCDRKIQATVFDAPSSTAYILDQSAVVRTYSLPGGTPGQFAVPGVSASAMTVAGGKMYAIVQTAAQAYALYTMGLDGSAPAPIATGLPTNAGEISALTVDGPYAFYLDRDNGYPRIYRVKLATGATFSVFYDPGNYSGLDFVASAPYLYIASNAGIVRVAE